MVKQANKQTNKQTNKKNNLFIPAVAYNRRMDIASPKPARNTACAEVCVLEFSIHMGALVDGP